MAPPPEAISSPAEPRLPALSNPLLRYFLATRPAFLSVTAVGVILGLACASLAGAAIAPLTAMATLIFACVAHAGVNVLNDYYDALSGTDDANTERLFPFTGGSRFIQNGVLTRRATALFGYALLAAVVPAGLWLAWQAGPALILIGLAGLLVGWAYSAPPFKLASRGLGELAVASGWWLVVVGSALVQTGAITAAALWAGAAYALLVANLLYINQFPDAVADGLAGKRTVVVRLGRTRAAMGYLILALASHLILVAGVLAGALPLAALAGLLALAPALKAFSRLRRHAEHPAQLRPAIGATIATAHIHGLAVAIALFLSKALA